jgi:hypothetical protein
MPTERQTEQIYDADILFEEMDNDFDRYPLPLCFDERDEVKELWQRERRLRLIAERFARIKNRKP